MDERRWIAAVLAGDVQSFSYIVAKYEKMAYTIAVRIVKNREDAEEVVQDAFLKMYRALPDFRFDVSGRREHTGHFKKMYRALPDFRFDSKFSSWFYRIVYRTALTALSGQRLFPDYEEIEAGDVSLAEQETATSLLERKDRQEIIAQVLNTLEKGEALLLTLYYLDECSVDEIVRITDLTESNVKTKLFRARRHFYAALEKRMKDEMRNLL